MSLVKSSAGPRSPFPVRRQGRGGHFQQSFQEREEESPERRGGRGEGGGREGEREGMRLMRGRGTSREWESVGVGGEWGRGGDAGEPGWKRGDDERCLSSAGEPAQGAG